MTMILYIITAPRIYNLESTRTVLESMQAQLMRTSSILIIDTTIVEYACSPFFAALVAIQKQAESAGKRVIVAGMQPAIHGLFVMSRLNTTIECYKTLEEAKQAASGPAPS